MASPTTSRYTGFLSHVTYATETSLVAMSASLLAIGTCAVALRFYVRRIQKAPLLVDDWLTLPSLLMVIGIAVSMIIGARGNSLGHKTPFDRSSLTPTILQKPHEYVLAQQVKFASQLMQLVALGCIKISVLFFYRRIFCTSNTGLLHYITLTSIALVAGWSISFFFAMLFMCGQNFEANWGSIIEAEEICGTGLSLQLGLAVSDLIMDCLILVMPLPMLWKLHVNLGRKIALTGIFILGAVAVAASAARLGVFVVAVNIGHQPGVDPTVDIADTSYWVMFECGFALIAACLPTLHFLFGKFSPDALVRSIRSVISLSSLRSQRSHRSQVSRSQHVKISDQFASSQLEFGKPGDANTETSAVALRDLEGQTREVDNENVPHGQILVEKRFSQTPV